MKNKEDFVGFDSHEYRPIVRTQSIKLLEKIVSQEKPKQILEIGTFIGYSASVILNSCNDSFVTTIEISKENATDAEKNLCGEGFGGRFEVVNMDTMEYLEKNSDKKFDFIFLDGAKGQYFRYLPYLKQMLKKGGFLLADDVLFYGLVRSKEKIAHKHRSLVNNLRKFLQELENDKDFDTTIFDFENGMSLSKKKI